MKQLPTFPDFPSHTMKVDIDGERLTYRRVYRPRMKGWYVDIFDQDGDPILLGARLSPGTTIGGSASVGVPVYVLGPSPYRRDQLGDELREYVLDDVSAEGDVDDDGFIVEFINEGGS